MFVIPTRKSKYIEYQYYFARDQHQYSQSFSNKRFERGESCCNDGGKNFQELC